MKYSDCWYKDVCDNVSEDCQKHCAKYLEMTYLMEHSGIPPYRRKPIQLQPATCDVNAFRRLAEIKENMADFVQQGKSLYITSNTVGNGKTSWALKLLMRYFAEIWEGNGFTPRGIIVHVPTFLLKCKDFKTDDAEFEEMRRLIPDIDLVVWDDIASTNLSSYDYSQLLMCLDAREFKEKKKKKKKSITDRQSLETALGAKITSRIWNNHTEVIEFNGRERR